MNFLHFTTYTIDSKLKDPDPDDETWIRIPILKNIWIFRIRIPNTLRYNYFLLVTISQGWFDESHDEAETAHLQPGGL
jgi:hypothetical protein